MFKVSEGPHLVPGFSTAAFDDLDGVRLQQV
jgi:hypothetical protein